MNLKPFAVLCLPLLSVSLAFAQTADKTATMPRAGAPAPELHLNHLLQAPTGAKADWPSLRGKVVVLEFWATWCAPCLAEIPVLNALQASVDPAKVQVISIDDEDPAVVEAFLKKKPIAGWIGIDTTSGVFMRYGGLSRPTTVVIDADGRVVSTTVHPEDLSRERLMAVAEQKPVDFAVPLAQPVNAKAMEERDSILAEKFSVEMVKGGQPADTAGSSPNEVTVTPGEAGDGHIMELGHGRMDATNTPAKEILNEVEGIPPGRITVASELLGKPYNVHMNAPKADAAQLNHLLEAALAVTGVKVEHVSKMMDVYVLTSTPAAKDQMDDWKYPGGAMFDGTSQKLMCIHATPDQFAGGLEIALQTPVVNETGLAGKFKMMNLGIVFKDVASARAALQPLGLTLTPARRSIDTLVVSLASASVATK